MVYDSYWLSLEPCFPLENRNKLIMSLSLAAKHGEFYFKSIFKLVFEMALWLDRIPHTCTYLIRLRAPPCQHQVESPPEALPLNCIIRV